MPLHYGHVPPWLAKRMGLLGGAIIESIIVEYGRSAVLNKLSDPLWFQALGCVMGMDWHSSGITTSVMGALKRAINPRAQELGIYICGGKGKHSHETPTELLAIAQKTGLDGQALVRSSKLTAKVDNTAIQDGFQLYLHSFVVSEEGEWAVVQQGMNETTGMARRYHWHSAQLKSYTETPHTSIYGKSQGIILNLTDLQAKDSKEGMLHLVREDPGAMLQEIRKITMPTHHQVTAKDVNLKRLGAMLVLAHERELKDFESLLLLEGLGPRTIQSLALVSEVIHGASCRFEDPARFSFAHGGKDGHPFPVPTKVYDETIQVLHHAVDKSRLGNNDKAQAIKSLSQLSAKLEQDFVPEQQLFEKVLKQERRDAHLHGGRTVFGKAQPPKEGDQLSLF